MSADDVLVRIVEVQAGKHMRDHPTEGCRCSRKHVPEVQTSDHRIVHFEQQTQAIAFMRKLSLRGLCALEVQRVVHGDRHLSGHLL